MNSRLGERHFSPPAVLRRGDSSAITATPLRSPAALTTGGVRARTADEIRVAFEADGAISTPIGELDVSIEDWRWIARSVARRLGRSVATKRTPTHVSAGLETRRVASTS